jgi:hypothetical protein
MAAARVAAGVTSLTCQEPRFPGLTRTAAVDPEPPFATTLAVDRVDQEADIRSGLFARLTTASRQFVEQQFIRVGRREGV